MKIKLLHNFICIGLFLFMAGCVSFGQMDKGMDALIGQNEQAAFDVLGYPDAKNELGDSIVYMWGRQSTGVYYAPQNRITYGQVGGVPYTANSTYYAPQVYSAECSIKVIVKNGIIQTYDYYGNLAGCEGYIMRLNNNAKLREKNQNDSVLVEKPTGEGLNTSVGNAQDYISCLEREAPSMSKEITSFESLSSALDKTCRKKTGGYYAGMAAYHARFALDNR